MDYKTENEKEREYYNQDFSVLKPLFKRIRDCLISGRKISISDLNLKNITECMQSGSYFYITLFQPQQKPIRYGSIRKDLTSSLNRNIEMLRKNKNFPMFNLKDENSCRIMIEFIIERRPILLKNLNQNKFNENRFEIGINGLELKDNDVTYCYMPSDGYILSHLTLKQVLNHLAKKTAIGKMTNSISQRIDILFNTDKYEYFLTKSRVFISYKNDVVPLYRGNILYKSFNYETVLNQFINSCSWLVENMYEDGRFLYYYNTKDDNFIDHEHPDRTEDNLYYNDLRHAGGIITLINAYNHTKDKKFINAAKKALDYCISITREHEFEKEPAYYSFLNNKAKLGGAGLFLTAMMRYRMSVCDRSYDLYIQGYVRHILSRMLKSGEFLAYYIHPKYNDGKPLIKVNDKDKKEMFSFYYPGEALLGLALFANHFDNNEKLVKKVIKKSAKALDWIVDKRPKCYKELFTALPSDAWLMQAVEEWCNNKTFRKQNLINFVFNDAAIMMEKMYGLNDSPYIDYEGGYFYNYGDHYYLDGARSEGLISAYYLADKLNKKELAEKILVSCKHAAKNQFSLYTNEINNYAHKNPLKSDKTIRFKATRQYVRVDTIQHVACFFIRLYYSENKQV